MIIVWNIYNLIDQRFSFHYFCQLLKKQNIVLFFIIAGFKIKIVKAKLEYDN